MKIVNTYVGAAFRRPMILIALLATACGSPQSPPPQPRSTSAPPPPVSRRPSAEVAAVVETPQVAPGGEARVGLEVRLPAKVHVQSNAPKDPLFIPTVLTIDAPQGTTVAEIVYPEPGELRQTGLDDPLIVFGSQFVVNVRLKVARTVPPGPLVVPASFRYQACDDTTCYPPQTAQAQWSLEVRK